MTPADIQAIGAVISAAMDVGLVAVDGIRALVVAFGFASPSAEELQAIAAATRADAQKRASERAKMVPA